MSMYAGQKLSKAHVPNLIKSDWQLWGFSHFWTNNMILLIFFLIINSFVFVCLSVSQTERSNFLCFLVFFFSVLLLEIEFTLNAQNKQTQVMSTIYVWLLWQIFEFYFFALLLPPSHHIAKLSIILINWLVDNLK